MKVYYFTGTGNSLFVTKSLSDNIYSIPQLFKNNDFNIENEVVGLVFPTYGANPPKIIYEFINKVSIKSKYLFVIMTCSDDNSGATNHICNLLRNKGIHVNYSNVVYMPTNHIPFSNLEIEHSVEKNVSAQLSLINNDILNFKNSHLNNKFKYLVKRNLVKTVHKFLPIDNPINFSVTDQCIKCKVCLYVCPRKNISLIGDEIIIKNHCEYCLSCVHNCPKKAIAVKNDKSPNVRYRNPNVSLTEIKSSNNQY